MRRFVCITFEGDLYGRTPSVDIEARPTISNCHISHNSPSLPVFYISCIIFETFRFWWLIWTRESAARGEVGVVLGFWVGWDWLGLGGEARIDSGWSLKSAFWAVVSRFGIMGVVRDGVKRSVAGWNIIELETRNEFFFETNRDLRRLMANK